MGNAQEINQIATIVKQDLAWLAVIHVVLRSDGEIENYAKCLLDNSDNLGFLKGTSETIQTKTITAFKKFKSYCNTNGFYKGVGHYLNESAILHIDAILQEFLDKVYKYANNRPMPQDKQSISSKLKMYSEWPQINDMHTKKNVLFIAELRHVITHQNGIANEKFLKAVTKKGLWDTEIWATKEIFYKKYKGKDGRLNLSISEVVIPYFSHAIDFVDELVNIVNKPKSVFLENIRE
ncbi:MAG: hypothetical protein V1701_08810 [Planctomycetota bacterium]